MSKMNWTKVTKEDSVRRYGSERLVEEPVVPWFKRSAPRPKRAAAATPSASAKAKPVPATRPAAPPPGVKRRSNKVIVSSVSGQDRSISVKGKRR